MSERKSPLHRRFSLLVLTVMCLLGSVAAQDLLRVDEADRVPIGESPNRLSRAYDTGLADPNLRIEHMTLVLAGSEATCCLARGLYSWTHEEMATGYALVAPLETVRNWLRSHHLVIEQSHDGLSVIRFNGTVAQMEEAFRAEIHGYVVNRKTYQANAECLTVPRALSGLVRAVRFPDDSPRANGTATASAYSETVLHDFTGSFYAPAFVGMMDSVGNLYGTTSGGGPAGAGTVFKVTSAGQETVLYAFTGTNGDGVAPNAGLVMDTLANLYGTTAGGGSAGYGSVFKVTPAGQETVLYSFTGTNGDGVGPNAGLVMDNLGNLYGTTYIGGSAGNGTVFKVTPAGQETVLYSFTGTNGDGVGPNAGLVMDNLGNLYGTTYIGGSAGNGTVFKVTLAGQETVLYSFLGCCIQFDGAFPNGGLIMDSAGNLYGTTSGGGSCPGNADFQFCGTVFRLDSSGHETLLYNFTGDDAISPNGGLIMDSSGNLYGTTATSYAFIPHGIDIGAGTVFKLDSSGNETVLYNFTTDTNTNTDPNGGLIMDVSGNLYGITETPNSAPVSSVFKLDPAGHETVLYTFPISNGDGGNPNSGLAIDSLGNLYGTTESGGASSSIPGGGGTVFKLDSSGHQTALYSFPGANGDGAYPPAGLIMDSSGNLYGTTAEGGSAGYGSVFKVTPDGQETVLYSFTGGDGALPQAGLIMDSKGNLYGTTEGGGSGGDGTVFKLTPAGQETVLHSFSWIDGNYNVFLNAGLAMDGSGNLYGTTGGNSAVPTYGIVFEVTPAGQYSVLYSFSGTNGDGAYPKGGLMMDSGGNLYGTTGGGGPAGAGTVFKVTSAGQETVLYSFTGTNGDGVDPNAGLAMDSLGNLYGTTAEGGSAGDGTVFEVTPAGKEMVLHSFTGTNGDGAHPNGGLIMDTAGNLYGATFGGGQGTAGTVFKLNTPWPDFTVSAGTVSPSSITPGQSSSSTITVTSENALNSAVSLTCSVSPTPSLAPTCAFSVSSVTPASNGTGTSSLTIVTTAATTTQASTKRGEGAGWFYGFWLPLPAILFLGAGLSKGSRKRGCPGLLLGLVLAAGIVSQLGCGGGSSSSGGGGNPGTPAGNYTITVTAKSGSIIHTTTATLTVQ